MIVTTNNNKMKITISSCEWQKINVQAGITDYLVHPFSKEKRQIRKDVRQEEQSVQQLQQYQQKTAQNFQALWNRFVNLYNGNAQEAMNIFANLLKASP